MIGKRVRLIKMDDIQAIEPGTEGIITGVDDMGQMSVAWDNGRSLRLVEEDEYEIIG